MAEKMGKMVDSIGSEINALWQERGDVQGWKRRARLGWKEGIGGVGSRGLGLWLGCRGELPF
jgi:hypothetical protein